MTSERKRLSIATICFVIAMATITIGANAETLELDTNQCTFNPEIARDECYTEYLLCPDGAEILDLNEISINFADLDEVKENKVTEDDLKIELPDLNFEIDIKLQEDCYKVELKGEKLAYKTIDHVLVYNGIPYLEYAFWNETYTYRRAFYGNVSSMSESTTGLIPINLSVDGRNIKAFCEWEIPTLNDTIGFFYYNNYTDGICVNTDESTAVVTLFVDGSKGTDYGEAEEYLVHFLTLGDCSGSNCAEHSRYDNTIMRTTTNTSGYNWDAQNFDGSTQHLNLTNNFNTSTGNLTVLMWANADNYNNNRALISKRDEYLNKDWEIFRLDVSNTRIRYESGAGITALDFNNFGTGSWFHFAYIKDNNDHTVYFDTAQQGTNTQAVQTLTGTSDILRVGTLGGDQISSNGCFDGRIDNVMIWNRTLSDNELKLYYHTQLDFFDYGAQETNGTVEPEEPVFNATVTYEISGDLPIVNQSCEDNYLIVWRERQTIGAEGSFTTYQRDRILCAFGCYDEMTRYGSDCSEPDFYIVASAFGIIILIIFIIFALPNIHRRKGKR